MANGIVTCFQARRAVITYHPNQHIQQYRRRYRQTFQSQWVLWVGDINFSQSVFTLSKVSHQNNRPSLTERGLGRASPLLLYLGQQRQRSLAGPTATSARGVVRVGRSARAVVTYRLRGRVGDGGLAGRAGREHHVAAGIERLDVRCNKKTTERISPNSLSIKKETSKID